MFLEKKKNYKKGILIRLIIALSILGPINHSWPQEEISDEELDAEIANALGAKSKPAASKVNKKQRQKEDIGDEEPVAVSLIKEVAGPVKPKQQDQKKTSQLNEPTPQDKSLLSSEPASLVTKKYGEIPKENKKLLYSPVESEPQSTKHDGYVVERDSSKIIKKKLSVNDTLNIKLCYSSGASVSLDEDVQGEFQRIILDDKTFFDAIDFENHRGVYVKLKQPIDDGKFWESAIRLVRKDNDKEYVINLIGVSCPPGMNPFPKVYYLQEKYPTISGKSTNVNTPEDNLIELSQGFPRKNKNNLTVYDMVARSGSDWAILGLQLELESGVEITPEGPFQFKVIDNLQISEIQTRIQYLPLQSEKAGQSASRPIARFKLVVNLNKQYFLENRYFYIMLVNKNEKYHQYIRVDSLPYIVSLRKRGFDI